MTEGTSLSTLARVDQKTHFGGSVFGTSDKRAVSTGRGPGYPETAMP